EAAGPVAVFAVHGEELLRGEQQPPALAGIHRSRAAPELRRTAVTHLDEHHGVAVAHHQVEFAVAETRVRGQRAKPGLFEVRARRLRPVRPVPAPWPSQLPGCRMAVPLLQTTHAGVRRTLPSAS